MLIQLSEEEKDRQWKICETLGVEELLGQLTEECGELIQAAQKMRRVICGTTPVGMGEAIENLVEEAADVALCIDTLIQWRLISEVLMQSIGRRKNERWYNRVTGDAEKHD